MATNHTSLDAAASERKARLAKLASLKRKQPSHDDEESNDFGRSSVADEQKKSLDVGGQHLSGRNYDPEARGPRLGFENAPSEGKETLESRAKIITEATKKEEQEKQREEKPLDLFSLQPKKPNWDLKRDLAQKTDVLEQRTDNAIARIVRERIEGQKVKENESLGPDLDHASLANGGGLSGVDLVESVRMKENEEADAERREKAQQLEDED